MSGVKNNQIYLSQIELDELAKMPKQYRTNKMMYRLTRQDVMRVREDASVSKAECDTINNALNVYLNERRNVEIQANAFKEYFTSTFKEPEHSKDFYLKLIICGLSYFYNVPYNQITEIKNINNVNGKSYNMYDMLSYEELNYINRLEQSLIESGKKNPYKSELDAIEYAKQLGASARNSFMKKYGVDPMLVERNEYPYKETEAFQGELKEKIAQLDNSQDQGRDEEL